MDDESISMEHMADRLADNFTVQGLVGLMDYETLGHLYDTAAHLMGWDD